MTQLRMPAVFEAYSSLSVFGPPLVRLCANLPPMSRGKSERAKWLSIDSR